jgi:hypothetical protein
VWDAIGDAGAGYDPYYRPGADWVPHITLAQLDLTPESLGAIVARLATRPLAWDVPLADLTVVRGPDDAPWALWRRYTPGAPGAPGVPTS